MADMPDPNSTDRMAHRRLETTNRQAVRYCRIRGRLARDFERYATTVAAFVRLAMIRIMLRRLAANHSS